MKLTEKGSPRLFASSLCPSFFKRINPCSLRFHYFGLSHQHKKKPETQIYLSRLSWFIPSAMAVVSVAAEKIDLPRPPMDPSLPKLASDVNSDSTSPNDSSPTDTPDRNDPSNSWPNPSYRDVEIQVPFSMNLL